MAQPNRLLPLAPAVRAAVQQGLEAGETLDELLVRSREAGWTGSRSTLAARIAEIRARPEAQLADLAAAPPPEPEPAAEEPPEPEAAEDAAPEVDGLSPRRPRDTLTDLREAQSLMRSLAQRAVAALKKGKGSEGLCLKAIDSYAALTLKIRRLERDEKPKEQKAYKLIEVRMPAKDTVQ